jgi:ribonuclease T1
VFNRRRITVALVGLLVLVIAGWLIKNAVAEGSTVPEGGAPGARSLANGAGGQSFHSLDGYQSRIAALVVAATVDAEDPWR